LNQNERNQELILVDENDSPVGFESKLEAHRNGGKLHRAFSIFIFDAAGRTLLQRRAKNKYHFAGLWTNACCSHPTRGEALQDAVHKRLQQEFGFDTELKEVFSFLYRASDLKSGLTEYELDHVFCGEFNGEPDPNPDEIDSWKWVDLPELAVDLDNNAHHYTPWFKIAIRRVIEASPDACPATVSVQVGTPGAARRHNAVR
jgi:isopentenyl-diphosphate delta-isomerase